MKTKFAIAAIALALTSASAFAANQLGQGKVTVYGNVKDSSCTVSAGQDGTNSVTLADVEKSALVDDVVVKSSPFTIEVSNCSLVNDAKNLVVTLTADAPAVAAKGYLNNIAAEDKKATNVYIAIVDKNGENATVVVPGEPSATAQKKAPASDADKVVFNYEAGYVAEVATTATPGLVSGAVSYTVTYN